MVGVSRLTLLTDTSVLLAQRFKVEDLLSEGLGILRTAFQGSTSFKISRAMERCYMGWRDHGYNYFLT